MIGGIRGGGNEHEWVKVELEKKGYSITVMHAAHNSSDIGSIPISLNECIVMLQDGITVPILSTCAWWVYKRR